MTIKEWFIFHYNSIHNSISYKFNVNKANKLHKLTGKQYHVVPKSQNSLMVVDNSYIKYYNQNVPKSKRIDIRKLSEMSYYSTKLSHQKIG